MADPIRTEEFRVDSSTVVDKVKALLHEGNVRRIILRSPDGKDLLEIPLTIGVGAVGVGLLVAPVLVILTAVATVVAVVAKVTIVVERRDDVSTPTKTDE